METLEILAELSDEKSERLIGLTELLHYKDANEEKTNEKNRGGA